MWRKPIDRNYQYCSSDRPKAALCIQLCLFWNNLWISFKDTVQKEEPIKRNLFLINNTIGVIFILMSDNIKSS